MKISEVIESLNMIKSVFGDLNVSIGMEHENKEATFDDQLFFNTLSAEKSFELCIQNFPY